MMNRRMFLGAAGSAFAASRELRVAVLGTGSRGTEMIKRSLAFPEVRIQAVCDIDEGRAAKAQEIVEQAKGNRPEPFTRGGEDYKRMLDRTDIDAVLIMTPQNQHAPQSIYAMNAGKHVGSETPAAYTIDDCWKLVETKERTARRYMLLENYPYARSRMIVLRMAHQNAFGYVNYGESSYIHDTRYLSYESDGSLSWRGQLGKNNRGDLYPTHGLGPVSLWMGINRGDRYTTIVSMDTGTQGIQAYAREKFGASHPAAQPGFFQKGDRTVSLLRTEGGRMVVLRFDSASTRPFGGWEALQGTLGSYDGSPGAESVYLKDRSPHEKWEPLAKYQAEFEHPYWKKDGAVAASAGHGGGDYFVLSEFYQALLADREPPIDVYDAVTWTAVLPLSGQSIREGNRALDVPDFTRGKWKARKMTGFGLD